MQKIYNEFGISLVLGEGNWLGFSCEIEDGDNEVRIIGWKKISFGKIKDIYFRFWLFNKVLIISYRNGFSIKYKSKYALKIIFGFSN